MNNDNGLNLHSITKLSGWLRYWSEVKNKLPLPNLKAHNAPTKKPQGRHLTQRPCANDSENTIMFVNRNLMETDFNMVKKDILRALSIGKTEK